MTGPVAVVTGAASGIGAATARELTGSGWRVAALDLQVADGFAWSGRVDMSDARAVSGAVAEAESALGPVSAVVSAAGVYGMRAFSDITLEQWNFMLRLHLGGLLNLMRAITPGMVQRGEGSIVAVASELAIGGGDGDAHYSAAKGAVIGLVRAAAAELAANGLRINAVAPGPTDTPMLEEDSPWRATAYVETLPLRRLVQPGEIAGTIRWLIEEGTFCVGEVLSVNAGAVI